jgi:hypothetical protein
MDFANFLLLLACIKTHSRGDTDLEAASTSGRVEQTWQNIK